MNIIDLYQSNFEQLNRYPLPEERLNLPENFVYIDTVDKLFRLGVRFNVCLKDIEKLKFYIYCLHNKDWNVYLVRNGNQQILTTITTYGRIVEAVKLHDMEHDVNESINKKIIAQQLTDSIFLTQTNSRDHTIFKNKWRTYKFAGIKEGTRVDMVKAVYIDRFKDSARLVITEPDQLNNKLHKQHTAWRLPDTCDEYITDSLSLSDEECFKFVKIMSGRIEIQDINNDSYTTLDIVGSVCK